MHEHSLVRSLLKQVEQIQREHEAECVVEVRVEIGPLSGVEPLLVSQAFEQLSSAGTVAGARLVIQNSPLLARCTTCDTEFEVIGFVFRCADCGGNVQVVQGDRFQLVSVSLQFDQEPKEMAS